MGIAGLVVLGVAIYQLIRGARQKFLDDSNTQKMSPAVKKWFTVIGTVGVLDHRSAPSTDFNVGLARVS